MYQKTMFGSFRALLGMGLIAASSSVASAAVVLPYATDFESDALASEPAGWNTTTLPSTSGGMSVVAGTSTGGLGANAQVLEFKGTSAAFWGGSFGFAKVTDQALVISFKVKLATGANATDFKFIGETSAPGGQTSYLRLRGGGAGAGAFSYYDGAFHTLLGGVVKGDWYQVVETLDLTNKTFDISIDNLDDVAPAVVATGLSYSPLGGGPANSMNLLGINRVAGASADFQIDDLDVHVVIPEPASVGLFGLGVLLMASSRRKL